MNTGETPPPSPEATEGTAEKYIRTFEGDMEILKKGGTPDLTPLDTPDAVPAAAPTPLVPAPPQISIADSISLPTAAPKAPPENPLETYSGDFTDRVKETHASTATVLAAEQDASPRAVPTEPETASRMNMGYLIAGGVLVIAGIGGIYAAYVHYQTAAAPVAVAPVAPTPIFVNEREEVSGTGEQLIKAIQASVARPLAAGTVRLLTIASTTSSGNVFAALSAVSAPDVLVRNVSADGSMAGVININNVQSPFFVLSVVSYSDTFSGMLSWEPVMPLYLADLYPPTVVAPEVITASTTATSTTSLNKVVTSSTTASGAPVPPRFFDITIANHDARAYRDATGRIILVYGYWNTRTMVIARDIATFTELLGRLATARTP